MNQDERRRFLIKRLLAEQKRWNGTIPEGEAEQKRLLRSCMNVRMPAPIDDEFLDVQDAYLKEESRRKGITDIADLTPAEEGIYLWQGDITTLRCDAIVNAANAEMTGCYVPCHACIDNCIHTFAGVQLRLDCARLMEQQGHEEETGKAKITPAYNLPCRYVLHTVGPIVRNAEPTRRQERELADCYNSCLALADAHCLQSIAFCCISTGEFGFPQRRAAEIAVDTVRGYLNITENTTINTIIFDVFSQEDYSIYREILR